jgi:hypothetical protein
VFWSNFDVTQTHQDASRVQPKRLCVSVFSVIALAAGKGVSSAQKPKYRR